MKACPYCGEVYQDTAFVCLKCRHDFRNPSQRASVTVPRATKHAKVVRSIPKPKKSGNPIKFHSIIEKSKGFLKSPYLIWKLWGIACILALTMSGYQMFFGFDDTTPLVDVPALAYETRANVDKILGTPSSTSKVVPTEENGFITEDAWYANILVRFRQNNAVQFIIYPETPSSQPQHLLRRCNLFVPIDSPDRKGKLGIWWENKEGQKVKYRKIFAVASYKNEIASIKNWNTLIVELQGLRHFDPNPPRSSMEIEMNRVRQEAFSSDK